MKQRLKKFATSFFVTQSIDNELLMDLKAFGFTNF